MTTERAKAMDEEKRTLGLLLCKIDPSDSGASFGFHANVVEVTADEKIRNPIDQPYSDLGIWCHISRESDFCTVMPEYRNVFSIGIRRMEAMAKFLKQVHARVDKHYKQYGAPADPADAFMRLAHAIGVKVYAIPEGVSHGWSYDDQEHRLVWDHDVLVGILRRMFQEARQPAEKREVA